MIFPVLSGCFPGSRFFPWHPGYIMNFNCGRVSKLWYRSGQVLIHNQDWKYHGNPEKAYCWVKSTSYKLWYRLAFGSISINVGLKVRLIQVSWTLSQGLKLSNPLVLRSMSTQQRTVILFWAKPLFHFYPWAFVWQLKHPWYVADHGKGFSPQKSTLSCSADLRKKF